MFCYLIFWKHSDVEMYNSHIVLLNVHLVWDLLSHIPLTVLTNM